MAVVVIVTGALAFVGGMQYQKSRRSTFIGGQFPGGPNAPTGEQRNRGNLQGMQPVSGEIIGQDESSITIKMQNGSSKIVILSDKTIINKTSEGSKSELKTGEKVTVFGTTNSDESVTAQTISIGNNFSGMRVGGSQPGENPLGPSGQ